MGVHKKLRLEQFGIKMRKIEQSKIIIISKSIVQCTMYTVLTKLLNKLDLSWISHHFMIFRSLSKASFIQ